MCRQNSFLDQPVLSNEDNGSCSGEQREPSMGLEVMPGRLGIGRYTNSVLKPSCLSVNFGIITSRYENNLGIKTTLRMCRAGLISWQLIIHSLDSPRAQLSHDGHARLLSTCTSTKIWSAVQIFLGETFFTFKSLKNVKIGTHGDN